MIKYLTLGFVSYVKINYLCKNYCLFASVSQLSLSECFYSVEIKSFNSLFGLYFLSFFIKKMLEKCNKKIITMSY